MPKAHPDRRLIATALVLLSCGREPDGPVTGVSQALSADDCPAAWRVVSSADGAGSESSLGSVAAITASDVWAVGSSGEGLTSQSTLAEHWNGSGWSVVPTPNGSMALNFLTSVSAVSSTDVWAVGYSWNGSTPDPRSTTLIAHWNGASWSIVPSPNTTRPENYLYGVVARSASDVWAVGTSVDTSVFRTLTMHWNGTKWSIVASPNPTSFANILYSVDAAAANDVWAVGSQEESLEQTLVLHWNGTSWAVVPSPQVGPFGNNMLHVSVVSPADVWAVGYHLAVFGFNEVFQTSAFHYDGTSWKVVATPNVNQQNNYLRGVVGLGPSDAWAVGFFDTGTTFLTMIQHWDGAAWSIVDSPNPGSFTNELYAAGASSAGDVWAVGRFTGSEEFGAATLVERFSSVCPVTMHVSRIVPSFVRTSGGFQVRADVVVVDAANAPVAGATVSVDARKPSGSVVHLTGTTNASGRTRVSLTSRQTGKFTFIVKNVAKAGATYDPAANVETSDSIVVR